MNQSNSKWRHYFLDNGSLSTPILIFFAFCLLLLRAWPRLLYPEVWIEDGTENIYGLNDTHSRNIIRERNQVILNSNGNIPEAKLPDVQRDLVIQNNKQFMQSRKR